MANTTNKKKRVLVTLDENIVNTLKQSNIKVSTLINNLLIRHLSLNSKPLSLTSHNPEVSGSNPLFVIFLKYKIFITENFSIFSKNFEFLLNNLI